MAAHTNTSGALLILPDGTEVKPGASVSISADVASGSGVAEWLANGWLTPEKKAKGKADAESDSEK